MERDKNYDLELAKYIWSILKIQSPRPYVLGS